MKRILTTALLLGSLGFAAQAQNRASSKVNVIPSTITKGNNAANKSTGIEDALLVAPGVSNTSSCGYAIFTVGYGGTAIDSGFISGTNIFHDKEKMQRFTLGSYGYALPTTLDSVIVLLGGIHASGNGLVSMKVYGATSTNTPGALLGTSIAKQVSKLTATDTFRFASSVPLTTNRFFVSFDLSALYATGDSVSVVTSTDDCVDIDTTVSESWEKWSDDSFHSFNEGWGFNVDMAIFPALTAHTAGVATLAQNAFGAQCFPIPASGNLNLTFNGASNGNTQVVIKDLTGKTLISKSLATQKGNAYHEVLDISSLSKGFYFCELSAGNSKSVLKVSVL